MNDGVRNTPLKLSSVTGYLDFWQTKEKLFWCRQNILITHSLVFLSNNNGKGKSICDVILFSNKNANEDKMGTHKRRKCCVCFILEWTNRSIFQSVKTISQFRERIRFSIHFKGVLWSMKKTTEVEYGFIKALRIHTERTKRLFRPARVRNFLSPASTKMKASLFGLTTDFCIT